MRVVRPPAGGSTLRIRERLREQIEVTLNVADVVIAGPSVSQIAAGLLGFLHNIAVFSLIYSQSNPDRENVQ